MLNENLSLEEKIKNLKDKIADIRDYISSDFCNKCIDCYNEIKFLDQQLKELENERTGLS